jgi:predicted dehydrogenase
MSDGILRLGLVGCGRLATSGYLPALATLGPRAGIRLVAVAERDPARRSATADLADRSRPDAAGRGSAGVGAFAGAEELLAGAEVDGIILATPAAAHVADAERAAAAGVAVLVEKPPAPDAAGAAALAAVLPAPWVGFNRRFDPGARAVRQAVPADGTIELRLEISYRRRSWGAHAVWDDALLDLGPHLVDWARWISGREVVGVTCSGLTAERVSAELALAGGGGATIRAATGRPHAELVELRDGSGRVLARHRLGGLAAAITGSLGLAGRRVLGRTPARADRGTSRRSGGQGGRSGGPSALVASLAGQLEAFAAAIRGEPRADLGTATDGVAAMTVIDAARESAGAGGRTVPVPHPVER